ncbi:hypothetical protein AGMMS49983_17790 [Clostridia bacterium]|nr:hypothetical protein AGMMS49983_17790 [Clostridia bacterium]
MLDQKRIEELIEISIEEAEKAIVRGDDPFGGVITDKEGNIIVRNGNRQNTEQNPSAHAEIVCIREACKKLQTNDLSGFISFCNAESCPMCASAMMMAGIRDFYFGTFMEDWYTPHVRMQTVADSMRSGIIVHGGILEEKTREVVDRGRGNL